MFVIALLFNLFCNSYDTILTSNNFFHQSTALLQIFERRFKPPVTNDSISLMGIYADTMESMVKKINDRAEVATKEFESYKSLIAYNILNPSAKKDALGNDTFNNAVITQLSRDWDILSAADKKQLLIATYVRFEPYQNLYAEMINTKQDKNYLKALRSFAINYEILKNFRLLVERPKTPLLAMVKNQWQAHTLKIGLGLVVTNMILISMFWSPEDEEGTCFKSCFNFEEIDTMYENYLREMQ